MYRSFGKRLIDILAGAAGLLLLSPLLLTVALLISIESPGNPIFVQMRVGRHGKLFPLYKFRSMVPDASLKGKGHYFDGDHDPRITRVGRFIRKASIDELPSLLNVLKGEMSLVGPRPMLPYQYEHMTAHQRERFAVAPGITGLAQLSGRNTLPWSQRFEFDIAYIRSLSLGQDLKLLLRTVTAALTSQGVDHQVTPEQVEDFIYQKRSGTE